MRRKLVGGAVLLVIVIVFLFYFLLPFTPHDFFYGYKPNIKSHHFVVYGVEGGENLKRVEESLFLLLDEEAMNVYTVRNRVSENVLPFAFIDVHSGETIIDYDSFNKNNIYLFEDTSINEFRTGLISFYVGDEIDSLTASRHRFMRDSIFQTVFH